MSKISDELRKWCDLCGGIIDSGDKAELHALADRIDAEMVELPRDRDGVPIHVDDTVWLDDGQKAEVISIVLAECASVINCWTYGRSFDYMPSGISHKPADSWERIADELDEWRVHAAGDCRIKVTDEDIVHDLAKRIRKLAEKEH